MFENIRPAQRLLTACATTTLRSLTLALGCAALSFTTANEANAQDRWQILNQSFEELVGGYQVQGQWDIESDSNFVGWNSSTNQIEIWRSGFNSVISAEGAYHIELNANRAGRLSQEVCLVQGEILSWAFSHRARAGGGQLMQSATLNIRNLAGLLQQPLDSSSLLRPRSNRDDDWTVKSGSAVFDGSTGVYNIGFESFDSGSYGNFIDAINIQPIALMEFAAATYGDVETPGGNLPALLISGVVREATDVAISVTSTTATAGVDYTVAGDIDNDGVGVITIPAGTYDGTLATAVSGLITIINDDLVEGDEILSISLGVVTPPMPPFAFNTTLQTGDIQCAGPALSTTVYTIEDDDTAPVAMNDSVAGPVSEASVNVDILGNDTDADGNATIDRTTVSLIAPTGVTVTNLDTDLGGDVIGFDVPDQGTWSYNDANGLLTFAPFAGYVGDPSPVFYTVDDNGPNQSNSAMVSIDYVDPAPRIELVQKVAAVEDTNGNGVFGDAGDTVSYVYTAENTGDTALAGVQIATDGSGAVLDGFAMLDGISMYAPTAAFDPTASGYVGVLAEDDGVVEIGTATYIITPTDVLRGTISTQPTVTSTAVATGAGGTPLPTTPLVGLDPVTDISDAASAPQIPAPTPPNATSVTIASLDPDANGPVDAPTILNLPAPDPVIELVQSATGVADSNGNGIFGDAGDTVSYNYTAANNGNTALVDIDITDPGFVAGVNGNTFAMLGGFDGTLAIGAGQDTPVLVAQGTYVITPTDVAAGFISASSTVVSTASATTGAGSPSTDPLDRLSTVNAVSDVSDAGSNPALPAQDGDAGTSVLIAQIDPDTDSDPDAPTMLNLPISSSEIRLVQLVTGVDDTNGNGIYGDAGDTVLYSYTAENTGDTSLADVRVDDPGFGTLIGAWNYTPVSDADFDGDLRRGEGPIEVGTATYIIVDEDVTAGEIVTQPTIVATAVATGAGNVPLPLSPLPGVDPVSDLSDAGTATAFDRASGETTTIDDPELNDSDGNTATAQGDDRTVLALQSPGMGDFVLAKSAPVATVLLGQIVDYQIVATSTLTADLSPVAIVDTLPAGMAFVSGSATVDGTAVVPSVSGQTVTFGGLTMPANASLTVTLRARVLSTAPAGQLTNRADIIDELSGAQLGETAAATVTRQVESVFECSNVIGKVFDDVNGNGYQDAPLVSGAQVSNQDIFVDKLGSGGKLSPAAIAPQAEVGIPNVRLVTPSGTLITTDAHGRYSVPCAELPSDIGSNFMLKVDTRTLPTGYRMTTENPRVIRLTSGMMAEMNFGAAIGRVFDVDLSGRAYSADAVAPSAALVTGIEGVLRQITDTPTVIRISYYRDQEAPDLARARLAALEQVIQEQWADIGTYRLLVEKSVNQLQ